MKRLEERRKDLENAFNRLEEAQQENETELAMDGTLHRFEFTFELAWKMMKDYLEYNGIIQNIGSPREVIQAAFIKRYFTKNINIGVNAHIEPKRRKIWILQLGKQQSRI